MSATGDRPPLSPLGVPWPRREESRDLEPAFPRDLVRRLAPWDLGAESLYLAWELTRSAGELAPSRQHDLMVLILATLVAQRGGSTRLPVAGRDGVVAPGFARVVAALGSDPARLRELLAGGDGAPVIGAPGSPCPLLFDGRFLSHHRAFHLEAALARSLRQRLLAPPAPWSMAALTEAVQAVLEAPPRTPAGTLVLSPEQQRAAVVAVASPLSVITGGPGTGKTSIVLTMLRLLARLGASFDEVALAAPTGRAASRLWEAVLAGLGALEPRPAADEEVARGLPPAQTLHRLLGYSPTRGGFRHHRSYPLRARVVIVDEASMVDLELMASLVAALRDDARLVLLGDVDQLPPVGAGAVFRALVPSTGPTARPWRQLLELDELAGLAEAPGDPRQRCIVRLGRSFRVDPERTAGRQLHVVAATIKAGRGDDLFPDAGAVSSGLVTRRHAVAEVAFAGVELLEGAPTKRGPAHLDAFLARWYQERVASLADFHQRVRRPFRYGREGFAAEDAAALRRLLEHYDGARVLCVTRGDDHATGAERVSHVIQQLHREAVGERGGGTLGPGEPVVMQRNDYRLGLFNGDPGLVVRVGSTRSGDPPQLAVVFRRGEDELVPFPVASLQGAVAPSFAMTVHRAQGSEFNWVALILPAVELPLVSREVLYTAVTRARESVVIIGDEPLLRAGVETTGERWSGLAEALAVPDATT